MARAAHEKAPTAGQRGRISVLPLRVQTAWACLPFRRRPLMIFRPLLVRILARNPILRARLRFETLRG
jgi:hypothetical protein